ncbi:unnamed protein product [Clavelina lepadiformis]|uniref:Zinc finger PHD-type domain-containing protein n=1 Tax=Clavelina lepadiformis TaxID=159417 RepID=A0ABP0FUD4_CLALP
MADLNSSRSDARKRKRAAASHNDSGEDEGEVCVICNLLDPPQGRSRDVDWEGCDNCDLWYHKICLRDNGGLSALRAVLNNKQTLFEQHVREEAKKCPESYHSNPG